MSFRIGQKVVCVDDRLRMHGVWQFLGVTLRDYGLLDHNLNKGDVYTVTKVSVLSDTEGKEFVSVLVAEAKHFKFPNVGFPSWQFRPIAERKTDIAIFTRMLTPNKKKVDA